MLREEVSTTVVSVLASLPTLPMGKGPTILILGGLCMLVVSLIWTLMSPREAPVPVPGRPWTNESPTPRSGGNGPPPRPSARPGPPVDLLELPRAPRMPVHGHRGLSREPAGMSPRPHGEVGYATQPLLSMHAHRDAQLEPQAAHEGAQATVVVMATEEREFYRLMARPPVVPKEVIKVQCEASDDFVRPADGPSGGEE